MAGLLGCATGTPSTEGATVRPAAMVEEEAPPPVASKAVERGEALFEEGDLEGARAAFLEAIDEQPDDPRAYYDLGLVLEDLGQPGRAEKAYRRALELRPDFDRAQTNLGLLLLRHNEPQEAVALLEQAVARHPDSAPGYANLAMAREDTGDAQGAIEAYQQSLELDPAGLMARLNYGLLLVRAGQPEAGCDELTKAQQDAGGNRAALLAIGQGYRMCGRSGAAVAAMEQALNAGDGAPTPALLSELALAQWAAKDASGARASLKQALKLDVKYATAHYILGNIAGAERDYGRAEQHYNRYLELEPSGPLVAKVQERLRVVQKLKQR